MPLTSIVEAKEVIRTFRLKYNCDLNVFTLISFRYKIDKIIALHYLKYADLLCSRINEDPEFRDEFLFDISTASTEMFRDPDFWITLKDQVLPELNRTVSPTVWLPGTTSGNELFSFAIVLMNLGIRDHYNLFASSYAQKSADLILSGGFDNKHLEQSLENFHKVFPAEDFKQYLELINHTFYRIREPFRNVRFATHDIFLKPAPPGINLILFRNKLISFTWEFQTRILDYFTGILEPGGFLITGYQENVEKYILTKPGMTIFNKEERIYRKIC